jgi:hypothetical protein
MVNFKGRHSEKQYMPMKPIKFGFKVYMLCESRTGYVLKILMHGSELYKKIISESEEKIADLVLNLVENIHCQGYNLFMDRYYTSCLLFEKLRSFGIKATGTIQINRKGLPLLDEIRLEKGQFVSCFTDKLHFLI